MNCLLKISDEIKDFRTAREGMAAVEFALIFPVMLVLYMGMIEISQAVSVDRKMGVVASTIGDLVAQSDNAISASTLNDYFHAVELIMTPHSADDLEQLVTLVYVDDNGLTNVEWSVGYNGATTKTVNTTYTIPDDLRALAHDAYIVVSETNFPYQPWSGYVIDSQINLYSQFFHLTRSGSNISLT